METCENIERVEIVRTRTRDQRASLRILGLGMAIMLIPGVVPAVFQDQTVALGLTGIHDSQAAWGDYNNDGFTDLQVNFILWRNVAGTNFQGEAGHGHRIVWGDYDNDTYIDMFEYERWKLFRNFAGTGGGFVEVPLPAILSNKSVAASWADHNNDGYADVYVGGYEDFGLNLTFPDGILSNAVGTNLLLSWTQSTLWRARGITSCDFDEDGDQDVYVSNYRQQPNLLWQNDGSGSFTDVAAAKGVAGENPPVLPSLNAYGHTIGSCWGDLNNDGHFDLFVGNFNHHDSRRSDETKIFRNLGPSGSYAFALMNELDGADWQEGYGSPTLGDYDNDGDLDFFFTTSPGYPSDAPRLYRNDGSFSFVNVTAAEGLTGVPASFQAAWADFDNDGDLDLASGGKVYVNGGNPNHWLKVRLWGDGKVVNGAAIGAQVRIQVAGLGTLTRQVEGGTGQGNQNDLTMHFGLGSETGPLSLEIRWPEGSTQTVDDVSADQLFELTYSPVLLDNGVGATGVTHEAAWLTGDLLWAEPSPVDVFVAWGTNTAGTNAASWFTNQHVGALAPGTFSANATGLDPNTVYYYRCYATNACGVFWADSNAMFSTVGSLPFCETFDDLEDGDLAWQNGWRVSTNGEAIVQAGITYAGSAKACRIGEASVMHDFTDEDATNIVWIQAIIQVVRGLAPEVPERTNSAAFFNFSHPDGYVTAYDGTNEVTLTNGPAAEMGQWARVALRLDYSSKTWSLWMNDTNLFSNFDFCYAGRDTFSRITLGGHAGATTHVDNVKASLDAPPDLLLDDDGDGMDDFWEVMFFGSTTNSSGGVDDDADGDGFLDLYEFLAGTDPTNSASFLAIFDIAQIQVSNAVIRWYSETNKLYFVQVSTNLPDSWSTTASNIPATSPVNQHTVAVDGARQYLRIGLDE